MAGFFHLKKKKQIKDMDILVNISDHIKEKVAIPCVPTSPVFWPDLGS